MKKYIFIATLRLDPRNKITSFFSPQFLRSFSIGRREGEVWRGRGRCQSHQLVIRNHLLVVFSEAEKKTTGFVILLTHGKIRVLIFQVKNVGAMLGRVTYNLDELGDKCKFHCSSAWYTRVILDWLGSTGMTRLSGKPNLLGRPESQITGKLELPESWNYRKAGTSGKLIRPECWN